MKRHAEALTQNILGILIAFLILRAFGIPADTSVQLQAVFFVASYIRSYSVRRFFERF